MKAINQWFSANSFWCALFTSPLLKKSELNYAINEIAAFAEIVYPSEKLNVVEEDADDNKILECAVEGEVDYIVTNGKHLLKIGEFRGIRILTPKNFIEKISNF